MIPLRTLAPILTSATPRRTALAAGLALAGLALAACQQDITTANPVCVAAICENFESNQLASHWHASNSARVSLSKEKVFSGRQALKVEATGAGYNRSYLSLDLTPENGLDQPREIYGRMMMYLQGDNALGGDFTFLQADGPARVTSGAPENTVVNYRGRLDGRFDHFMGNYDTRIDADGDGKTEWLTDCWQHPDFEYSSAGAADNVAPAKPYLIPHDQWACVQWHFNADQNRLAFWLNGEELSALTIDANSGGTGDGCIDPNTQAGVWTGPAYFSQLHIGAEQYHKTTLPRTLYIDNLAVGSSMPGCDADAD
jgi:hypothetical protein